MASTTARSTNDATGNASSNATVQATSLDADAAAATSTRYAGTSKASSTAISNGRPATSLATTTTTSATGWTSYGISSELNAATATSQSPWNATTFRLKKCNSYENVPDHLEFCLFIASLVRYISNFKWCGSIVILTYMIVKIMPNKIDNLSFRFTA